VVKENDLAVGIGHDPAARTGFDDKPKSLVGQPAFADIRDPAQDHQAVFGLDGI
jgi:hypothetical protein